MNFFESILAHDPDSYQNRWKSPWLIFFLLIGTFWYTKTAATENHVASRQQTSSAIITDCEYGQRSQKYCHYTFPAGDQQYTGMSAVDDGAYFGQTKAVYYDSENPEINKLQNFSEASRHDRNIAYWLLLVATVLTAVVLYSNSSDRGKFNC